MKKSLSNYLEENISDMLDIFHKANLIRSPQYNHLMHRNRIPTIFEHKMAQRFPEIKLLEKEGKSYDWIIFDKKISVKSQKTEIFPRKNKLDKNKITKPANIIMTNTNGADNYVGEADYLFTIEEFTENKKMIVRMALFEMKKISKKLINNNNGQLLYRPVFQDAKFCAYQEYEIDKEYHEKIKTMSYNLFENNDLQFLNDIWKLVE